MGGGSRGSRLARGEKSEHVLGSWASRRAREKGRKRTSPVSSAVPYPFRPSPSVPRLSGPAGVGQLPCPSPLPLLEKPDQPGKVHFPRPSVAPTLSASNVLLFSACLRCPPSSIVPGFPRFLPACFNYV